MHAPTTDEDRLHDVDDGQSESATAPDAAVTRRGWGKHMLLGASALAVLFASGSKDTQAAPPTDNWKLGGNPNVDGTNFLGPTNSAPLIFKIAGTERMRIAASGNVGIGNASPASARLVVDVANGVAVYARHTATTGDAPAIRAETNSTVTNASAVQGMATNAAPGSLAAGVRGDVTNTTTFAGVGVYGRHAGNGYGVYAEAVGASGTGVYAQGGAYGIYSYASAAGSTALYASGQGRGVDAYAEAATGVAYGVYADADSAGGGHGVVGRADAGTGENFGVRGEAYSADGYAGHFRNVASGNTGTGVAGIASGATTTTLPSGYFAGGGEFIGANGVMGYADRASGYGVVGIQGAGAYAGYFSGNVYVSGTLSKAAGSFKIDHPLDPQNKYLSHSFVESPDMMNVYNGNATLDANGEAVVELPTYFHALNRDVRYQLTAIGAPGPNLHIAKEISGNRFTIAGGTGGMRVSWQVTGIRQDAYANAHRIPVEEPKPAQERGTYLAPEAFNQPASKSAGVQDRTRAPRTMPQAVPRERPRGKQPTVPSGE